MIKIGIEWIKKLNFGLLTNIYFFIGVIILLVAVLTGINNFYFYVHVERSSNRNAEQLESILENEIIFCRENRISGKRYRENIKNLVENFSKKAYYNDSLILKHEEGYIIWEKEKTDWDKVVASNIEIIIPKLKSDNILYYDAKVEFDYFAFLNSIFRSMSLSIFDVSKKIINDTMITNEDEKLFQDIENKIKKIKGLKKGLKPYVKKKYESELLDKELIIYNNLRKEILQNEVSNNELEAYDIIKNKKYNQELSSEDFETYWYRSRPAIGFTIFTIILIWVFRRREHEIKRLEDIINEPDIYNNKDIAKIIEALRSKKFDNIKRLVEEGLDINTQNNKKMTALMLYALEDRPEENKLEAIKVLTSNAADVNIKNNEGMNALMLYALENKTNDINSKVLKILIEYGANINSKNNAGLTALMLCSKDGRLASVDILLDNGADINVTQTVSASVLASSEYIRQSISKTQNTHPQKLVKILSGFTNKPMKLTTHNWDSGSLKSEYGTFDEAMEIVKEEFNSIENELKELSLNLHTKIHTFLFNTKPNPEYSWCSKANINIGWLNLNGLKEYCDSGKNAFNFQLQESIIVDNKEISTFGEIIDLFKQEIEMRIDFKNLETFFGEKQEDLLDEDFNIDISDSKLLRQFYTDTQKFTDAVSRIFNEIKKRKYKNIELITRELEDRSIEIIITQIGSVADKNVKTLLEDVNDGDFADIKKALTNLCDWSVESICEDGSFRINYLHSNNVKDIEQLETEVKGFTHILRFYR